MPVAAFTKFNKFVQDVAHKQHNFATDQLTLAMTNVAPTAANSVLADLTQISYTNASTRNLTTVSSVQTNGVYAYTSAPLDITAGAGPVGPFRYIVAYNSTAAGGPLISFFDYGSSITLAAGEKIAVTYPNTILFDLT